MHSEVPTLYIMIEFLIDYKIDSLILGFKWRIRLWK
ncbi:hypothetical protein BVRB_5g114490 [Beta vulgaris subsp. vulgaris]|nr:hypothetical protein BVRB_5g114490 [Beta vulgaris subsp. vulgaris]